jgi:hypothetical protein
MSESSSNARGLVPILSAAACFPGPVDIGD